jgi:hypothetical protein
MVTGPSAGPEAQTEIQRILDDALYYLRTDCQPCAERQFEKARLIGASEQAIAAVRAEHAADSADLRVPGTH